MPCHCDRPPQQQEELETMKMTGGGGIDGREEPIMALQNTTKTHSRNQALRENNPWGKDKTQILIVIVIILVLFGRGWEGVGGRGPLVTRDHDFGNGTFLFALHPDGEWTRGVDENVRWHWIFSLECTVSAVGGRRELRARPPGETTRHFLHCEVSPCSLPPPSLPPP